MRVIIQKQILIDLKSKLHSENKIKQLDYYVYYVSLLNSLSIRHREDKQYDKIIRLNASKMKNIYYKYNLIIKDLIDFGIINKVDNYNADLKKSSGYQINDKYVGDELESYNLTKTALLKKLNKKEQKVPTERIFLTEWFNTKLTFDYVEAIQFINSKYDSKNSDYESRRIIANYWRLRIFEFSVNKKSDNRFHSLLARTPKDLRQFIKYNGEELVGYDLKSSQLFFFSVILKSIIEDDIDLRENIGFLDFYDGTSLQNELESLKLDIEEINHFINIVINHDFYDYFSDEVNYHFDEEEQTYCLVYYNHKGEQISEPFESKRELSKRIIMIILNCRKNINNEINRQFGNCFPEIMKIIKTIKKHHPMHKVLQQVESYVLLDCVAKDISMNKDIPLFTLHDCFYTTLSNGECLRELLFKYILLYTTLHNNLCKV